MPNTKTVRVPHLGGTEAAYQSPPSQSSIDASKPTIIFVNSFTTSSELYKSQYANTKLTDAVNIVAIELLGHGQTRTTRENWTYWDTAEMNLQVMDALGIKKAFVLGTSQGGWICARMALLAPEKITGIMPLGTSMDYESERSRKLGCWDAPALLSPNIKRYSEASGADWSPPQDPSDFLIDIGFGKDVAFEVRDYWRKEIHNSYVGDEGRRRLRMATINLKTRDGLHDRLSDIICPVWWLHGTNDAVYSVDNAREEIQLLSKSPDAQLKIVQGGQHFLSFSNPTEVDDAIIEFTRKYHSA